MLFKNYLKPIFAYILFIPLSAGKGTSYEDTENYKKETSFTCRNEIASPKIRFNPIEYTEKVDTWDFDMIVLKELINPNTENYLDLLADVAIQSQELPAARNQPDNTESSIIFPTAEPKRREITKTYKKKNIFKATRSETLTIKTNNQGKRGIFEIHEKSSKSLTTRGQSTINENDSKTPNANRRQLDTRLKKKTKLFSLSSTKGKIYILH